MKLPHTDQPAKYAGLYVIDFGDQCAMGYTAEEVATLLESERYTGAKVYKIHRARPDGTMELQGASRERFALESGMFFHCRDEQCGRADFARLAAWSREEEAPCRAKMHLAEGNGGQWVLALIYPAEYEEEMGRWMEASGYKGSGPVDAGSSQVNRYYGGGFEIREREQLWPAAARATRDRETLQASVGRALQR